MDNRRRWNRAALGVLVSICLAGGAVGCGGGDNPSGGSDTGQKQCPSERPVRCADDSCARSQVACDSDEPDVDAGDIPYAGADADAADSGDDAADVGEIVLSGEVVHLSSRTVLAAAPEPVDVDIQVNNPEQLQELVDSGAIFEAKVSSPDAEPIVVAATATASHAGEDSDVQLRVEIPPVENQLVGAQTRLEITLTGADESVYSLGMTSVRLRGEPRGPGVDDREAYRLDGVIAPTQIWTLDLDGDGDDDHLVSDINTQAESVLRAYRCEAGDGCEEVGTVGLSVSGPDGIVAPDMLREPADGECPSGFLGAAVTERSDAGEISSVEVVQVSISGEADGAQLDTTRQSFDLSGAAEASARTHAQTLMPRMLRDPDTGVCRPGLEVTASKPSVGANGSTKTSWATVVLDASGPVSGAEIVPNFDGLGSDQAEAARSGQLAMCWSNPAQSLLAGQSPQGVILSAFVLDGQPMLAAGQIGSDLPLSIQAVSAFYDPALLGDAFGSVACKLDDFDGDGKRDLAIGLAASEVYSTLGGAHGKPASIMLIDGLDGEQPKVGLLFEGADAGDWSLLGKDGVLHFQTGRAPQTRQSSGIPAAASFIFADDDGDDAGTGLRIDLQDTPSVPPGMSVPSFAHAGQPTSLTMTAQGAVITRKLHPNDSPRAFIPGGHLMGSHQVSDVDGTWLMSWFSGGIEAGGDADAASLVSSADKSYLRYLARTGPYIPVENGGVEGLSDLSTWRGGEGDQAFSAAVLEVQQADDGAPVKLRVAELLADTTRAHSGEGVEVDLDFSQVPNQGRDVVKFKAGSDLSSSLGMAGTDSCGSGDNCEGSNSVLLVFEGSDGAISTGVYEPGSERAISVKPSGLREALHTALSAGDPPLCGNTEHLLVDDSAGMLTEQLVVGDFGSGPMALLRGVCSAEAASVDAVVAVGVDGQVQVRAAGEQAASLVIADVLGLGTQQFLECRDAESGDAMNCECTQVIDGEFGGACRSEGASTLAINHPGATIVRALDADRDGCDDLMSDTGQVYSSRCDGRFSEVSVASAQSGDWLNFIPAPGPLQATSHNASRSNRSNGIMAGGGDDDDSGLEVLIERRALWALFPSSQPLQATSHNASRPNHISSGGENPLYTATSPKENVLYDGE